MDTNLTFIKALVTTLQREVETLNTVDELSENETVDLNSKVREYETNLIRAALLKAGGNQRKAAELLNIKITTLNSKIKSYGIEVLKYKTVKPGPAREALAI